MDAKHTLNDSRANSSNAYEDYSVETLMIAEGRNQTLPDEPDFDDSLK